MFLSVAILMDLSPFRLLRSGRLTSYPLATLSDPHQAETGAGNKKAVFRRLFDFACSAPYKTADDFFKEAVRAVCLIA